MPADHFLGIDCGLTLLKAAVFTAQGKKLAEARRPTPVRGELIDAPQLFDSVCQCIREACEGLPIAAVGLSGHGNGLYALDKSGEVLAAFPSMIRSFDPSVSDRQEFFRIACQDIWSGQPMQLLRRLKQTQRGLYDAVCTVLHCKDYVAYRLTGQLHGDYSDASASALLDAGCARYSSELARLSGIPEKADAFPELLNSYDVTGYISRESAEKTGLRAGTPVAAGMFDAGACMLGSGVLDGSRYSITAGTWGISILPTAGVTASREITQSCRYFDRQHHMAVVSAPTSCVNLDWFMRNVKPELTYVQADTIADAYGPDSVQFVYLPYLHPDMRRPELRAGFCGMGPEDTWREMLRAVYEGVAFAHRHQLSRLAKAGLHAPRARLSGGAAGAAIWRQLFADICGIEIETLCEKQVGALGAAILAAVAAGQYAHVQEAVSHMVQTEESTPAQAAGAYDRKYQLFLKWIGEEV